MGMQDSPLAQLEGLLVTGVQGAALRQWLLVDLGEAGLKRIARALDGAGGGAAHAAVRARGPPAAAGALPAGRGGRARALLPPLCAARLAGGAEYADLL